MNTLSPSLVRTRASTAFGQQLAALSYFLLFPGFFAYHTVLGLGLIRAYLGGYFAMVAFALAPLLAFAYVRRVFERSLQWGGADFAFWGFQLYFALVVAAQAVRGAEASVLLNHAFAIVFMADTFIMLRLMDPTRTGFFLLNLLCLAAMSAAIFAFAVDGMFYLSATGEARDPEAVATYQGFSRSYLMTVIVGLAATPRLSLRLLIYGIALPSLYLNGARSEFAALLFLLPVVELGYTRQKLAMLLVFGACAMLLWSVHESLLAMLPQTRILELLDLSQSTSANLRHELSDLAWRTIAAHPFLGDYASYRPGYYAHSLLSAWVDLGLLGIVYLLALLGLPALDLAWRCYFGREVRPATMLAWALISSTLLLLFTSHYFADMLIGACLGAYAREREKGQHG